MKRFVARVVDFSGAHPLVVLLIAFVTLIGTWTYASKLRDELRTDLLELLPRESPGFKAFEHQLGRVGGGASLLVIVESPDRTANERFIDDLTAKLVETKEQNKKCHEACKDDACHQACGADLIAYLESGTKDVRQFFEEHKWLYADLKDLEDADNTLDHQIAIQSGLVSDFNSEDEPPKVAPAPAPPKTLPTSTSTSSPKPATPTPAPVAAAPPKRSALGMDEFRDRWKDKAKKSDDFPTGYFATEDGHDLGIRIVSTTSGMGGSGGEALMELVKKKVLELKPQGYGSTMKVGFAGDIPNVIEEKDSLLTDAAWATGIALVLILGGLVFFFRSPWSLLVVSMPAFIGVGCAYSFARATYGYVNMTGAFLGAIILGNGINYPIVLLSRYREFRARGQAPADARRDAVWNAFRAELVGALVGGIAYGSLVITRFRGFNQFGMIGFVGMLFVWITMIPTVPAMLVVIEWIQSKLPLWLRDPPPRIEKDGSRGAITKFIAEITERMPRVFLIAAVALCVVTAWKLPGYLKDPWEYNFDHLGSRGTKVAGAGNWSNVAEKVFGGKMNIAGALMMADTPEQVELVKHEILKNDAADKEGQLIAQVATVQDLLPGPEAEQKRKLEVLERIRERLTPAVLSAMEPDERARLEEVRPPETLGVIAPKDLPALLRRRFEENNGAIGTVFYVKLKNDVSLSDGKNLLRVAKTTDNIVLPDGKLVQTASRSTIFAEMIHSMERDGPLATFASFTAVLIVVIFATSSVRGAVVVISSLFMGVLWAVGGAALVDMKLNFLNFIALPITFGIGCEYPFNVFDRSRLLGGDITAAVKRTGGAVALCSYTTTIGYGSLLFADNQALQSFGKLAMSGEVACLAAALLVLPSLLHVWRSKRTTLEG